MPLLGSRGGGSVRGFGRFGFVLKVLSDVFGRTTSGSLGSTAQGIAWENLSGVFYANGSSAQSDTSPSSYPLASPQAELGQDVTINANVTPGTGVAFWVTDAGSWWAAVPIYGSDSSNSTTCGPNQNGCEGSSCTPSNCCGPVSSPTTYYVVDCNGCGGATYTSPPNFNQTVTYCNQGCGPGSYSGYWEFTSRVCNAWTTVTTTNYRSRLRILRSVSGTVSEQQLATISTTSSSAYNNISSVRVITSGNNITVAGFSGSNQSSQLGSNVGLTATSPVRGRRVGIIKSSGGTRQSSTIDDFNATIQ